MSAHAHATPDRRVHRARWQRVLAALFFALVAALLASLARRIEWSEVGDALVGYPLHTLLLAAALAATSHALVSTFDLLGRAWTQHGLPTGKVVAVNFVSYAFNLSLGALIGAFAFRYRLYSRLGLAKDVITRVLGLSLVTNWLGYLVLAGGVFAGGIVAPPAGWDLSAGALRMLGVASLLAAAGYLLLCGRARRREWTLRGHTITLPPLRLAWRQLVLSCINWLVIAATLTVLLQFKVPYTSVLATFVLAALAGVITHIPAGLGVLEAVFIAMLGTRLPRGELLAALLAYRALYYLLPLMLASGVLLRLETRSRHHATRQPATRRA